MAQAAGALSACLCGLECSAVHAVCFRQQQHEAQNRPWHCGGVVSCLGLHMLSALACLHTLLGTDFFDSQNQLHVACVFGRVILHMGAFTIWPYSPVV